MNNIHLKQLDAINKLSYLSDQNIDDLLNYLNNILYSNKKKVSKKNSVWGLWKNSKFDISIIEDELLNIRKKTELNILKKI